MNENCWYECGILLFEVHFTTLPVSHVVMRGGSRVPQTGTTVIHLECKTKLKHVRRLQSVGKSGVSATFVL